MVAPRGGFQSIFIAISSNRLRFLYIFLMILNFKFNAIEIAPGIYHYIKLVRILKD